MPLINIATTLVRNSTANLMRCLNRGLLLGTKLTQATREP
jgi:hypothetical protein